MSIASGTLRKNGMQEQAEEMRNRIFQCQSYDSALSIIGDYVNINFILPETGKPCLLFYDLFNLRNLLYLIVQILPFFLPVQPRNIACGVRCPNFNSFPVLFCYSHLVHVVTR